MFVQLFIISLPFSFLIMIIAGRISIIMDNNEGSGQIRNIHGFSLNLTLSKFVLGNSG